MIGKPDSIVAQSSHSERRPFKRRAFSLRRLMVGFVFLAAVFAWYQRIPSVGFYIAFGVGVPSFLLVLIADVGDIPDIIRCFLVSGIFAFIGTAGTLTLGGFVPDIQSTLVSGIFGWMLAVIYNWWARRSKAERTGKASSDSGFGIDDSRREQ